MLSRPSFLVLILTFLVSATAGVSRAQDIVDHQDAQLWLQLNSQIPVAKTWSLILEGQPRWDQNFSKYDQVVLRAGMLKRLTPRIQLSAAYAFVPRYTQIGTVYEHQAYQQAVFVLPRLGKWTPQVRLREDERYLSQWGEAAHRVRGQLRVSRPMPRAPGWTLVVHQELFVNWDSTPRGPSPGLDQHRLFTGVNHPLTRDLAIETGYLWQDLFRLGARPARHNHIAMVQFQFRPRGPGGRAPAPMPVPLPMSSGGSSSVE